MKKFEREPKIGIEKNEEKKKTEKKAKKIPAEEIISEKEVEKIEKEEKEELEKTREEIKEEYEREELKEIEKLEDSSKKLKRILELIDKNVFPKDSLPIKIVEEIKKEGRTPAAQHYFDENEKGKMVNEHYQVNENIDEKDCGFNDIVEISIHEVRHRVQHTFPIELFTRDNFKKFEKKYPSLRLLKERLPEHLSPNDFDACMVENLSSFLRKNGVSLSEISKSIIPKDAKEIFENIEILAKKKNFTIPGFS